MDCAASSEMGSTTQWQLAVPSLELGVYFSCRNLLQVLIMATRSDGCLDYQTRINCRMRSEPNVGCVTKVIMNITEILT